MRNIGLAISGGGIKSYAAIGVLKYLESENIKINHISGTSMGSIIAALYACGLDSATIEREMLSLKGYFEENKIISPSITNFIANVSKDGYADSSKIEQKLAAIFLEYGVKTISDIKMPLAITAVDLISGNLVLFTNRKMSFAGEVDVIVDDDISIAKALVASCSVPIIFQTKHHKNMQLVDGGVRMNVPIYPLLKMAANYIISISMSSVEPSKEALYIPQVTRRVIDLLIAQSTLLAIALSDLNINVLLETSNIFATSYGKRAIEKGYLTAKEKYADKIKLLK